VRVAALDVAEVVDVVADGQLGFVASGVVFAVDELSAQVAKKLSAAALSQ